MFGFYDPSGGIRVTVVSETDEPYGLYAADGSLRVTEDGSRGLYAKNGAIRTEYEDRATAYTASGAINGDLDTVNSVFYPYALGTGEFIIDGVFYIDGRPLAIDDAAKARLIKVQK